VTLLMTRHAETVWHRENRYAGTSDIDLSPNGVQQAQRLAEWVRTRKIDAVVCSPVRRARETAAPSALAAGLEIEIEDDLREVGFGIAEGRTLSELDADVVARFRADPVAHPFPGAEQPTVAAERCAAALRRIAARHADHTVLVIAHNTLLRLGLCALLGLPVARYRQVFPRLDNVAVTEIALADGGAGPVALLSLNVPVGGRAAHPVPRAPVVAGARATTPDPTNPTTKENS
jgi:2,3-bisphosphoglycerate-dependent phosphoglycerate mutase